MGRWSWIVAPVHGSPLNGIRISTASPLPSG